MSIYQSRTDRTKASLRAAGGQAAAKKEETGKARQTQSTGGADQSTRTAWWMRRQQGDSQQEIDAVDRIQSCGTKYPRSTKHSKQKSSSSKRRNCGGKQQTCLKPYTTRAPEVIAKHDNSRCTRICWRWCCCDCWALAPWTWLGQVRFSWHRPADIHQNERRTVMGGD